MKKKLKLFLWHIIIRRTLVKMIEDKISPLLAYPTLVWVEFEGKEVYLNHSYKEFIAILNSKISEILNSIHNALFYSHLPCYKFEYNYNCDLTVEEEEWMNQCLLSQKSHDKI